MVSVPTDKLRPGQILVEEVRDINGRLLLAKGNEIGANHIRIFKIWGISEVTVAGAAHHKDKLDPAVNPEPDEQAKEKVKLLFNHVDLEHPAIKEIYRLSVQFRYKHNLLETGSNKHINEQVTLPEGLEIDFRQKLKKKKIILPELPSVVFELNEVISNPMSSTEQIARVVNTSPSLTAFLLKIVNSSFYGLPSRIDTVSHAVTLLGTREISSLALGICILSVFKKIPKKILDMYSFVKHSLACGILSRILAARKNLPYTEQMFVSGLLHDLGRLILYIYFPNESHAVLSRARAQSKLLFEEENVYLGRNHAQVGKLLMEQWKLPLILENNIFYHHKPSAAQQPLPATIVHLADMMVNGLGIGSSGEKFVPPLDYRAWENLELLPSSFESIVGQAIHQFDSLESILDVY
jgi:HD-like signal output (HDOD) protein